MTASPPDAEEVDKALDGILNSFVFNSDSRRKILGQQLTYEYFGYPLDWLSRYYEGIQEVSVEAVRQAAEKYLHPDKFAILVVGPAAGRDRPLEEYGEVTELDITIPELEVAQVAATAESRQRGAALIARAVDGGRRRRAAGRGHLVAPVGAGGGDDPAGRDADRAERDQRLSGPPAPGDEAAVWHHDDGGDRGGRLHGQPTGRPGPARVAPRRQPQVDAPPAAAAAAGASRRTASRRWPWGPVRSTDGRWSTSRSLSPATSSPSRSPATTATWWR